LKRIQIITISVLLFSMTAFAQDQPTGDAANPLTQMRDQVKQALQAAGVPFTEDQEKGSP